VHLPDLLRDLALILTVAGLTSVLFRFLRQPPVLAYLVAGVLVGPEVTAIPTVIDRANVQIWADLGVIFLFFSLGLEFSFRKLLQVGRTAVVTAAFEVGFMLLVGLALGRILGWTPLDSLFLGGILAISSTAIILKAFQDSEAKTQQFARFVLGVLVIEDLFGILLLALLSTIAAAKGLQGLALLRQLGVLAAFLATTIPLGLWVVPRFLRGLRRHLNEELRVVLSLALCLLMVVASSAAGFSVALGAFLMGAIMGETAEGERVERTLAPIRDLFAAIFFTSVGMLLDFGQLLRHPWLVALVALVTIVGKIASTTLGMRISGQNRRVALQAGLSMPQIGEFSFVIGMLGLTLGVIRQELYPLAVAVSVLTTFSTPYFVRWAMRLQPSGQPARGRAVEPALWDGHLAEIEVHPHSRYAGSTLGTAHLRDSFGISVVSIHRGDRHLVAPGAEELIMPHDRLVVLGTDEQLVGLERHFRFERHAVEHQVSAHYDLVQLRLGPGANIVGKPLRESGLREMVDGLVLGIERRTDRMLNPDPATPLEAEDVLWIYGRRELLWSARKLLA
jgi:Kef-type K+ transport system membrane component KefB/K+/H+ antiporter YhaU regulatory subunit KhtT